MANNSNVTEACSLPPNKRYICTHNSSGKSIVHSSPPQVFHPFGAMAGARSYATSTVPAVLKGDVDVSAYLATEGATSHMGTDIVVPTGKGANLIAIDLPPGSQSGMHRTVSIDYSICVIGHVCMELDGGETLELRPGDHVIQRGTMHKWYNGSQTEPARFIAVTLPCEAFEIPGTGKMLAEEHLQGTSVPQGEDSKL